MNKAHRCPICGVSLKREKDLESSFFPFCSARCRSIDLGRWLGEEYRLPANPDEGDSSEEASDSPRFS